MGAASILNIWTACSASNNAAFVPEQRSEKTPPRELSEEPAGKAAGLLQQGSTAGQSNQLWPTLTGCTNCKTFSGVGSGSRKEVL